MKYKIIILKVWALDGDVTTTTFERRTEHLALSCFRTEKRNITHLKRLFADASVTVTRPTPTGGEETLYHWDLKEA